MRKAHAPSYEFRSSNLLPLLPHRSLSDKIVVGYEEGKIKDCIVGYI